MWNGSGDRKATKLRDASKAAKEQHEVASREWFSKAVGKAYCVILWVVGSAAQGSSRAADGHYILLKDMFLARTESSRKWWGGPIKASLPSETLTKHKSRALC